MIKKIKCHPLLRLSVASLKMYFRNFTAVFFSLLFPIIFLLVFGFVGQNDNLTIDIAYINRSDTAPAQQFDQAFSNLLHNKDLSKEENEARLFKNDAEIIRLMDNGEGLDNILELAKRKLSDGSLAAAVIISEEFGINNRGEINLFIDEANEQFAGLAKTAVEEIVNSFNRAEAVAILGQQLPAPYSIESGGVRSQNLGGIDYLVPGIIAFSVMSLGIFSVSQGFVSLKSSGALRRLHVAPLNPLTFLMAQSITRLIMTALNVILMVIIGIVLFSFNIQGSLIEFTLFSILGSIMFIGIGFAIAGWAKDENQAAPIGNIIFFPMMFLSGTFFPRELFPEWLKPVTDYMPLTYVADGLREIANNGLHIWDLGPEILGIVIWTAVIYLIAVRLFRWE